MLDKFIKDCGKCDYIIRSDAFRVFARCEGEVVSKLQAIPLHNHHQLFEKYLTAFNHFNFEESEENMKIHEKNIAYFKNLLMLAVENVVEVKKNASNKDKTRLKSEKQDLTAMLDCLIGRDLIEQLLNSEHMCDFESLQNLHKFLTVYQG